MKGRELHGIQLFCDARHMGREVGVQTAPRDYVYKGFPSKVLGFRSFAGSMTQVTCDHIQILFCMALCFSQEGYRAEQPTGNVTKKNTGKD